VTDATPHWDDAKEAATRAHKLERQAKEVQADLRANSKNPKEKAKLQARLDELTSVAAKERKLQSDEQVAGDAIYWPIFNLDQKNPNSVDALEHRPPLELVESILRKEKEILRLIIEIQSEVKVL